MFFNRNFAIRAIEGAEFRIQQADEIPNLGDGGNSGFPTPLGDALLDGDGRRDAEDRIDVRPPRRLHSPKRGKPPTRIIKSPC